MQLTEHRPGDHHIVNRVDADAIWINQARHQRSLILGARLLIPDWPVTRLDELDNAAVQPLIHHQPELVLIGIGERQQFPAPAIQRAFLENGIGLECMTLAAAGRTFNVLMSENRRVVAGFILS
ncbi:MAG: Mth938-like domain-containing protein [Wenzhouxiangella sp.]|nr:Mth938-like domain-containing protein [Wenzhouxiangella sp.]MCH8478360.1 Mth938-like domain-containing protein [Wenzhouxiangella sp.]TVR94557.1 MAG: hypothetical protein EA418_09875 [Wenzhouxiangellaceae bacterium]